MRFNRHFELEGRHSLLSPSNPAWLNYDEEKMARTVITRKEAARGTRLHKLAHDLIKERQKLPELPKTLNMYVNQCIGWSMEPEVGLYYSDNAFGTADAMSFRHNVLRISDLKTGVNEASVVQLEVYAALFCLEYKIKPGSLDGIELRIYQNDEIKEYIGDPTGLMVIIDKIIAADKLINQVEEELS